MVLEKPSALQELSTKEPTHTAGACYKRTLELLPPKRQFPWFLSPEERIQPRDREQLEIARVVLSKAEVHSKQRENEGEQAAWKQEAACNRVGLVFQSGGKSLSLSCVI